MHPVLRVQMIEIGDIRTYHIKANDLWADMIRYWNFPHLKTQVVQSTGEDPSLETRYEQNVGVDGL